MMLFRKKRIFWILVCLLSALGATSGWTVDSSKFGILNAFEKRVSSGQEPTKREIETVIQLAAENEDAQFMSYIFLRTPGNIAYFASEYVSRMPKNSAAQTLVTILKADEFWKNPYDGGKFNAAKAKYVFQRQGIIASKISEFLKFGIRVDSLYDEETRNQVMKNLMAFRNNEGDGPPESILENPRSESSGGRVQVPAAESKPQFETTPPRGESRPRSPIVVAAIIATAVGLFAGVALLLMRRGKLPFKPESQKGKSKRGKGISHEWILEQ